MLVDPNTGITRQTIVDRVKEHESHIKRRVLAKVQEFMKEPIPESAYQKCLMYGEMIDDNGDVTEEFNIDQDWEAEMYQEFLDMVFYEAMHEARTISKRL